jgi:hypothetical protein
MARCWSPPKSEKNQTTVPNQHLHILRNPSKQHLHSNHRPHLHFSQTSHSQIQKLLPQILKPRLKNRATRLHLTQKIPTPTPPSQTAQTFHHSTDPYLHFDLRNFQHLLVNLPLPAPHQPTTLITSSQPPPTHPNSMNPQTEALTPHNPQPKTPPLHQPHTTHNPRSPQCTTTTDPTRMAREPLTAPGRSDRTPSSDP